MSARKAGTGLVAKNICQPFLEEEEDPPTPKIFVNICQIFVRIFVKGGGGPANTQNIFQYI